MTLQPVFSRMPLSRRFLPTRSAGMGQRKMFSPSVSMSTRSGVRMLMMVLAAMEACDITRSAPAAWRMLMLRSRVARLMIWMSGRRRRQ